MNYKQYANFQVDVHQYLLKTHLPHIDNNDQNKALEISYYGFQIFLLGLLGKKSSCICSDLYKFAEVVFLQMWLQGFVIVSVLFDTTFCSHTP